MRHSPLRTIHPVPNRRNEEVEIGEKYVWYLYRLINVITISVQICQCPYFQGILSQIQKRVVLP